ncbi:hypothetical protein E5Q_00544 [Mixia osmundae IAM 14324]|uniref:Trehalase n=1 Tax=Mixia osmundae (strain CBS 9802 / IAM 14324 / JCM 22182 / KY 12970) TaxID=764103 RepID=G7DT19_MIXOS|nr:hypothetical protein E5Q_00544 [Mixia osmundae IAM 14324]
MISCHTYAGPSCEFPPRKTWRQTVERGPPVTTVPTQRPHNLSGDLCQLDKHTGELLSTIWRANWRYSQPFSASSAVLSGPTTRNTLLPSKPMSRIRVGTGGEISLGEEFPGIWPTLHVKEVRICFALCLPSSTARRALALYNSDRRQQPWKRSTVHCQLLPALLRITSLSTPGLTYLTLQSLPACLSNQLSSLESICQQGALSSILLLLYTQSMDGGAADTIADLKKPLPLGTPNNQAAATSTSERGDVYGGAALPATAQASTYYKDDRPVAGLKTRTLSLRGETGGTVRRPNVWEGETTRVQRRLSHDAKDAEPRKFLIDVDTTMRLILEQEDTDGDFQISITDAGPKIIALGTATSNGFKSFDVRGTWMLSVLLQELALARQFGRRHIVLDQARLSENPVDRLSRMIKTIFWHNLTRSIDEEGLEAICKDPKNRGSNQAPRIYVPIDEPEMAAYYRRMALAKPELGLDVQILPREITAEYVQSLNDKPGILALAMERTMTGSGEKTLAGIPFIVPGARFNELYNWDSYFIALGLLVDDDVLKARGIVEHFAFEIRHYGKILNGSRSYYLCRSQPPFLTDLAMQVYARLEHNAANKEWLRRAIKAAIKEYHVVWMAAPRLDPKTGLSRYRPDGKGIPPETEASHFTHVLQPYAKKNGISVNDYIRKYNSGEIEEPELDAFFLHDRAVRESGHDTSYRLEGKCADLATIDLNALLFKYETDVATAISEVFDDDFELDEDFALAPFPFGTEVPHETAHVSGERSTGKKQKASDWIERARRRKKLVDHYCWNEGKGMFFDYNTVKHAQEVYESAATFWPLWSGMATPPQADLLVKKALPKFEVMGGLVAGTEESTGQSRLSGPSRQWDWPSAWSPHQILCWVGLERYGYTIDAQRLAYRWLYMLTAAFVDFNGVVPEKFDAVKLSHRVDAEYGNQGVDFQYVPVGGFGWTNASYQIGLTLMTSHQRRALGALTKPEVFFAAARRPHHHSEDKIPFDLSADDNTQAE